MGGQGGVVRIDDPEDPRIAAFRNVRDRDLHRRDGLFMVEGEVTLRVLLSGRSRFSPRAILLAEGRIEPFAQLLADLQPEGRAKSGNPPRPHAEVAGAAGPRSTHHRRASFEARPPASPDGRAPQDEEVGSFQPDSEMPVYVAAPSVMDTIAGFPIHRGVLALAERGPVLGAARFLEGLTGPATVLALAGLSNHDNVGGAFRNAAAFGAAAVLLDRESCDPLYRKAVRVSAGAALTVPFARAPSAEVLVEELAGAGFEVVALSPSGREPLGAVAWPDRAAILVGREGAGLPAALLARLRSVRIAMAPGVDSLNVATASGVALAAAFGRSG